MLRCRNTTGVIQQNPKAHASYAEFDDEADYRLISSSKI